MQQKASLHFALLEVVHELLVFLGPERRGYQRLGLAARKQSRAVRARQPADFAVNRANLRKTAPVRPASMVENVVAENLFFQMVETLFRHHALLELIVGI